MKTIIKSGLTLGLLFITSLSFAGDKKVQSFVVERVINASAADVWKVVGEDFGAIANSHPQIVSSNYIGGTLEGGEGAKRVCNFNDKGSKFLHEEQVSYDAENYSFKVKVFHSAGLPLDSDYSLAEYKVVPIDETSCKFVFTLQYRTKPAFLGAMAKGKFVKNIKDYAIAIEHHTLTGEKVNKDNFKGIKKQYKS